MKNESRVSPLEQKRTIVRANSPKLPFAWKLVGWAMPSLLEDHAVRRFATPERAASYAPPAVERMRSRAGTVRAGRENLATWTWGGDGPTVLLAHGWNGSSAQMTGFVAPLVRLGWHVVAFDQPAHGRSTGTAATLVDFADAVLTVARAHHPVRGVIGHSLGATAAALAMRRDDSLAEAPAVLIAPPVEVTRYARAFAARMGLPVALEEGMLEKLRKDLGADFNAFDLRELAPGMHAPLLLAHDPADREVPFESSRSLAAAWPGARLRSLEGLGHRRMLTDPAVIQEAVRFLTDAHTQAVKPRALAALWEGATP